jgi:cytochrome c biogenesis protein CcmG/thiol:disulfide interchange protein DsbE
MKAFLSIIIIFVSILSFNVNANDNKANQAPNWTLKTQAGKSISLADYQGKPVILHFWATWCPYCKKLQPKLVELTEKYKNTGIEIVAISFSEDEGAKPQTRLLNEVINLLPVLKGKKLLSYMA